MNDWLQERRGRIAGDVGVKCWTRGEVSLLGSSGGVGVGWQGGNEVVFFGLG